MTDVELERQALALFEQMLEVPEGERDAWVAQHTQGRPELASRINAIREADRKSMLQTGAATDALYEEDAPERIGAYRIVSRLGRGGMGSVYRGERATGAFFHRSEERRVGKECVSTGRSRGSPTQLKKN